MSEPLQRLSKYLAAAGVASRRACEELIFAGSVTVNGDVVFKPQTLVGGKDSIAVKGKKILPQKSTVYYMLNKPVGYICSTKATKSSRSVYSLFGKTKERLFTVGRLDVATSGLLLVTNDGSFAHRVAHPSSEIEKEYIAEVDAGISDTHLKRILKGTEVEGRHVRPKRVKKLGSRRLCVVVTDGRKREVRCLVQDAGLKVVELQRIRIGKLKLGALPAGEWKTLSEADCNKIFITSHQGTVQ